MSVRATGLGDISVLREIERASGQQFRALGLPHIADDEPAATEVLAGYVDDSRSWVAMAAEGDNQPIGFVLVDEVDRLAHIEQVSVLPDYQGNGYGRALVERVVAWAAEAGRPAVTLTTYDHIPWNRPLYEHLGFRVISVAEMGPELRALRAEEARRGMDPGLRVAMRLDVDFRRPGRWNGSD